MKTEKYLIQLGVNPSHIGFKYLSYAIDICKNDNLMLYKKSNNLYRIIAEDLNTNKTALVRMMQYAVDKSIRKIPLGEFLARAIIDLG